MSISDSTARQYYFMLIDFDERIPSSEAERACIWFDEHSDDDAELWKEFFHRTSFGDVPARLNVYVGETGVTVCIDTDKGLKSKAMHKLVKFMQQFVSELDDIFTNRLQCKSADNSSEIVRLDISEDMKVKVHSRNVAGETSIWEVNYPALRRKRR